MYFDQCFSDGKAQSSKLENLLTESHEVCLDSLSLIFTPSAFFGDFVPSPPWKGISFFPDNLMYPTSPPQYQEMSISHLKNLFRQAVRTSIGNARRVAVALSGGVDSAAVLCAAHDISQNDHLDLIAVTTEQISDDGISNVRVAEQICKSVSPDIGFFVCSGQLEPTWYSQGPCLHALPLSTAFQADVAHKAGAEVLLTGTGSDELVSAPRYMLAHMQGKKLDSYMRLVKENGWFGPVSESLCILSKLLWVKARVKLYMSCNFIAAKEIDPLKVLGTGFRSYASRWEDSYIRNLFKHHISYGGSNWAEMDAFDTLYPLQLSIPSYCSIRTEAPFLSEPFFSAALSIRLADRFGIFENSSYHQRKVISSSLLRRDVARCIPSKKATFRKSIRDQVSSEPMRPLLVIETGLIAPDEMSMVENVEILPTIFAVERWLRGARHRGFAIGNV